MLYTFNTLVIKRGPRRTRQFDFILSSLIYLLKKAHAMNLRFRVGLSMPVLLLLTLLLLALCGCGNGSGNTTARVTDVVLTPAKMQMRPGQARGIQYTVKTVGTPSLTIVWSVAEGNAGGTVDQNGLYTAPPQTGIYHVVAASAATPTTKGTVEVTVSTTNAGVNLAVTQHEQSVATTGTVNLSALVTVTGTANGAVTWQLATPNTGTITPAGVYTPPSTPGTYTITVISQADTTQRDLIYVTVLRTTIAISPKRVPDPSANPQIPVLRVNGRMQFGYSINTVGSTDTGVNWFTSDASGNPLTDGAQVDANGNYIAASKPGTYYVTISSKDGSVRDTATITVSP